MSVLDRKLIRDLWHLKGQVVAIALVVCCGVATFVMALGTLGSVEDTRAAYYERYRFGHVFGTVKRAPESLAAAIARIPGVARVETRIVKEVLLDVPGLAEPATGRLVSIPERGRPVLNDLTLRSGRYIAPGRIDEVLISEAFAEANGLAPGDYLSATVNGRKRKLRVSGIALSPEYVYSLAAGVIVPDDRRFGILWMSREALAAAFDLDGAFNNVALSLLRSVSAQEVIERLDRMLERYGGIGAYDRDDQVSNAYLSSEMDGLRTIARIVPPIFLAVAAFLLNIAIARLVATEREQIGLLKAVGYGNAAIAWHYLKFVLAVVTFGVFLGFLGGAWLGRLVTELYTQFFRFPFLYYRLDASVFAAAAAISYTAGVLAAYGAARRAAKLPPATAMQPAPPTSYRRTLLERLAPLRLSEPNRMILRHIARFPIRAGLTTLGVSLAVAIMVGTLFFYDAIDHMIESYYFGAHRHDASVSFVEARQDSVVQEVGRLPGALVVEPYRVVPVRLRHGHLSERTAITGLSRGGDLNRLLVAEQRTAELPSRGLILSDKLAELLNVSRGERLTVEVLEGRRPIRQLQVVATTGDYIGTSAYMDRSALNRLMREAPVASGAYLKVDPLAAERLYRRLKDTPAVAGVSLRTAELGTFRKTMAETVYIMISFYIMFGSLLAVGIVYNSARIALSERGRELASLRVLGFTCQEVSYILLGELAVLVLLALPLGSVIGYGLAALFVWTFDTELYRIPLVVERSTYGVAMLAVVVAAIASGLVVRRRVDHLDLIAVLKTRE
jgi:putative ABC transport system permease protein